ncbi:MAG: bifunctional riboflavin kinase/FAD synthetase [Bryobacteraceae bacterium]
MPPGLRIFRSLEEARGQFGPCVLSIGNFDGVHAGHRRILRRVVELANRRGWTPSVLTFDPHPARIVAPRRAPRLLTTPDERAALMAVEGIRQVLILPFTQQVAHMSPEEFARTVLQDALSVRAVLVGSNFRFGRRHSGDTERLAQLGQVYGFLVEVIPAVELRRRQISSSVVRRLIESGDVATAARLLTRPHSLEGMVVSGQGIGSSQTVPTLNLKTPAEVLPASGVYITRTREMAGGRMWSSVTNVGVRPTFGGEGLTVETFLLDPLEGETPKSIRVEFWKRLRGERKFPSAEALKVQILRDAGRARRFHRLAGRLGCYTQREPQISQHF